MVNSNSTWDSIKVELATIMGTDNSEVSLKAGLVINKAWDTPKVTVAHTMTTKATREVLIILAALVDTRTKAVALVDIADVITITVTTTSTKTNTTPSNMVDTVDSLMEWAITATVLVAWAIHMECSTKEARAVDSRTTTTRKVERVVEVTTRTNRDRLN
jgi:hypothetical protein